MEIWKNISSPLREESETRRLHKKNSTLTTKTIEAVEKLMKNVADYFCVTEGHSVISSDLVYERIFLEDCYDLEKKYLQIEQCELAVIGDGRIEETLSLNPTVEFLNVLKFNDNAETLDYVRMYGFPLVIRTKGQKVEFTSKAFDTKSGWDKVRQRVDAQR